jgi:hypothetical protein
LEFLEAERPLLPALASGFGGKSSTERRFEMIANPLVSHRLAWWSYPLLIAALAVLPCLPRFTQAQDQAGPPQAIDADVSADFTFVPIELGKLDGIPRDLSPHSAEIVVKFLGQTERRIYQQHRSKLGIVVLAFEIQSRKLAWSSEIELPADGKAAAGQRFLLHTGGGVVTVAVVEEDLRLKIQELDAETGKVTAESRLPRTEKDRFSAVSGEPDQMFKLRIEELTQRQLELQTRLKTEEAQRIQRDDMIELLLQQQRQLEQRLKAEQDQRKVREDTHGAERKAMEADLEALSEKLRALLDEQLKETAESALRGRRGADFWQRPGKLPEIQQGKQLGDALVVELGGVRDGGLTLELASTVWRLTNGDAPISSIRMVREGGKDRMIIEGQAKEHRRIILELRAEDDQPGPREQGEEPAAPPGGAAAKTGAEDPLVQQALQFISRQRLDLASETVSVRDMLAFKPEASGIDYDQPAESEIESCRVAVEPGAAWSLLNRAGVLLRRFEDTNRDGVVDSWRYYQGGRCVYRDVDTDHDGKADRHERPESPVQR